jgi:hypothetical protein
MMKREETAAWLDKQGITVTNVTDPVDGSTIAVVDLDQLGKLVETGRENPEEALARALYLDQPHVEDWVELKKHERDAFREKARKLIKLGEPQHMWINAMGMVAPRDENLLGIGKTVREFLMQAPKPEKDEWGIAPWKRVFIEVVAS